MVDYNAVCESLHKEQIEAYRHYFLLFDPEESGRIKSSDLCSALKEMNFDIPDKSLQELTKPFDLEEEGNGYVSFDEFMALIPKVSATEEATKAWLGELSEIFRFCDKEKNGYISVSDFKDIVRALDSQSTEEALDDMIAEVDGDGTGTIEYSDFMAIMSGKTNCSIYQAVLNSANLPAS